MKNKDKILFISYSGPLPFNDGKRQRTNALVKALEEKYTVHFLIINDRDGFDIAIKNYESNNVKFLFYSVLNNSLKYNLKSKLGLIFIGDRGLRAHIEDLFSINNYNFIFSRYIHPVAHILKKQHIVCDIDDDFFELHSSRINNERKWFRKLRLKQIYWLNRNRYKNLISRIELPLYTKNESIKDTGVVIPNLPFQLLINTTPIFRPCSLLKILFVGKLSYEPNLHGIKWFIREVWPLLVKRMPSVNLTVVSSVPSEDIELNTLLSNCPEINVLINVSNIAELYWNNTLVIAPIFQGGGSNIKIAEALLMGRPVITTSFGSRGFESAIEQNILYTSDTPDEYLGRIFLLLGSGKSLIDFQQKIHLWANREYSFENWKIGLLEALSSINH